MKLHRLLASTFTCIAITSCAQTPPAADEAESARLARELRTLIGPANCSADTQCRTVPVGAKACGGPAGYWAWSTNGIDEARVADLATRQSAAHRREIAASGMQSNCAITVDPGAACVTGRCQLATPASAR
ncbi:hypothetical protein [Roseateles sp.]|uniref:hypothetical protein n=1 Tax=Roseateles sp. TaxID=1971397 RepID=UPI0032631A12